MNAPATSLRGRPFVKGFDPRRHKLTREECQKGFWAAIESIVARHPDAVNKLGVHIARNALPALIKKRNFR